MPRHKSILTAGLLAAILTAGGCNGSGQQNGGGTVTGQTAPGQTVQQLQAQTDERHQTGKAGAISQKDAKGIMHHTNIQLEASPYISQVVSDMDEIRTAKAAVSESNIYIAVQLEEQTIRDHTAGQAAEDKRIAAQKGHDGVLNDRNRDASPAGKKNTGIKSGITGNSYDYYQGKEDEKPLAGNLQASSIPSAVQQKIVEKVRSVSGPNIHHIFVSDDPQMFQAFSAYEQQAGGQTNWNSHVGELNQLANRVFPTTEGSGAYGGSVSSGRTEHSRQHNVPGPETP